MIIYYTLIFILGLVIGSFLNVCIHRLPEEKSVVKPPSHCIECGTRLKFFDLVPVLSYILLKGKCRHCGAKISARYPAVELLTGLMFVVLFYKFSLSVDFAAACYIMSILLAVFFIDYKHKIIPNELVVAGLIGGALLIVYNIFNPVQIYGDRNIVNPLFGMVTGSGALMLVALVGLIIYRTDDAMGMGDVKIMAPIGIFLGWKLTIVALMLSVFTGGIVSIILMIIRFKKRKDTIPFGPFIVIGTFVTLMWGWDILNWYIGRLM